MHINAHFFVSCFAHAMENRNHKSKDSQYNGKNKINDKKINNDLQTTTETNDPATRTPLKPHVTPLFLLL
jgi:hypothetical protein